MKVSYDFHIHTAASPCGDEQMTPNNIINLCQLLGKQMIAITDHNTCCNCQAVMSLGADKGIWVLPGMEIECMEEFHVIALFPTLESACEVEKEVHAHMPDLKNRVSIFGNQWVMNARDEIVGEVERILLTATGLSIYDLCPLVRAYGGVIYPAHIDRTSYSIISNLGLVPEDLGFQIIEVSKSANIDDYAPGYPGVRIVSSSDAHYLEQLCEKEFFLELPDISLTTLWRALKKC
ncbi:MAG: PHP domain-containing protein [Niameybacter sp.]|uniref:PHP domain-containing protein n=1 Tax=Niameybacter sp. TaxID=2033640 RepID=UPI002FC89517